MLVPRTPWGKRAKQQMIILGEETKDVAIATGMSRQYVTAIISGRHFTEKAVKKISDHLGISDSQDE